MRFLARLLLAVHNRFRLRLRLGRLGICFYDLIRLGIIGPRLWFLLRRRRRWRQRLLCKQPLRYPRRNVFNVKRLRFGDRIERPNGAEQETDKDNDAEQALELVLLVLAGRPWQLIFSVKR